MATTTYKNKKSSSLVRFKQNIKLLKDRKYSCRVCKTYIGGLGFIQKMCNANLHFIIIIIYLSM